MPELMIAGAWQVRGGELANVDLEALMHEHGRSAGSLAAKAGTSARRSRYKRPLIRFSMLVPVL
ncbi:hypothetical protein [Candidatus Rariloculus sp.]|uniref:hypothetical protein n=1 Tax=Candidatus Rariloculus sp. TaxID=3101265 RepID=UPI003D0A79D7